MSKSKRKKHKKRFILCKVYPNEWKDVYLIDKLSNEFKHIGSKTECSLPNKSQWCKDFRSERRWIPLTKHEIAMVKYWISENQWYKNNGEA